MPVVCCMGKGLLTLIAIRKRPGCNPPTGRHSSVLPRRLNERPLSYKRCPEADRQLSTIMRHLKISLLLKLTAARSCKLS